MKRVLAFGLCLLLALTLLPVAAFAEEGAVTEIATGADFVRFAQNCARESYSKDKRFVLTADIDLTGLGYQAAAYFAGSLDGQNHVIRGLAITAEGSRLGLFRQIGPEGTVENLLVQGSVHPGGSQEYIGGIAGVNEGTIRSSGFAGEVSGIRCVGGVAGHNTQSGSIRSCAFSGRLTGEHQAGGIAGLNEGLLTNCDNQGAVNTTAIIPQAEPHFDLASFSQEDFVDLSDIGGLAGENTGCIQESRNRGAVGYRYTGYNVGGVAGKSSGFLDGCSNTAAVEGRRDVGGVAGQLIPYAAWAFTRESVQELQDAIGYMQYLLGRATEDAETGRTDVQGQLQRMNGYSLQAVKALEILAAGGGSISWNSETGGASWSGGDTGELSKALNNMYAQSLSLADSVGATAGYLAADVRDISNQMGYILNLLFSLVNGGGEVSITRRDLSLDEAYEHDAGAVARCRNQGAVRAETNAGGLVGTVGFEIAFDMEDQLQASGFLSTHAEQSLFAAIRACENSGAVTARGDNAGGLAGRMDVGAVVDGVGTGRIVSQNGDCVGGVAGTCQGTLARCWARSDLEGRRYLGGVAGLGKDLLDCRAWTHISRGSEYQGAVAGWAEGTVQGNVYVDGSPHGVDGVSRIGQAESMTAERFRILEGIPEGFDTVTVRFVAGEKTVKTLTLPFGGGVKELPAVENQGRAHWEWDETDLSHVYSDLEVTGAYTAPSTVIASPEAVPLFLVEGEFYEDQVLQVTPYEPKKTDKKLLGAYTLRVDGYEGDLTVRMRSDPDVKLYREEPDGTRRELAVTADGQYLVFSVPNASSILVLRHRELPWRLLILGAAVLLEGLLLTARALARRRKKRRAQQEQR